ncbi:hypothetical protein IID24_04540 [Patescibacteria group bacterium]|nr:hypothetical protein [Patescibacteria group bacterium]
MNKIVVIGLLVALVGVAGYFIMNQQTSSPAPISSPTPKPTLEPTLAPSSIPTSTSIPISTPNPTPTPISDTDGGDALIPPDWWLNSQWDTSDLTPEEVLRLGAELNGKVIQIRGILDMIRIPFRDSYALPGVGPGFVTDDGNISMNAPAAIASISQNTEIVVRGVYDSEKSYLQLPPGCGISIPSSVCVEIVTESTP